MKKVFIHAYDKVNLGDDLFIRHLTARYPGVEFCLYSDKKNIANFQDVDNLRVFDRDAWIFKLFASKRDSASARFERRLKRKCDALVYIGGSIFIEYDTWSDIVNWWDYTAQEYPLFVLGANFGPYKTEAYRAAMQGVFAKMEDVCFRDRYSYGLFRDGNCVRYAPDILFACHGLLNGKPQRKIFLSVIDCASENHSDLNGHAAGYELFLKKQIAYFLADGYSVDICSFCTEEGDVAAAERILEGINVSTGIRHISYDGKNSAEILRSVAESELVMGTRFHAVVLGLAAGKKVYPLIYSNKTLNMLEDMSFGGPYADIRTGIEDKGKISVAEAGRLTEEQIHSLKMESEKHFEKLDALLVNG